MAATLITLADQIVTALNEHTFTPAVTAVRRYVPLIELKEMELGKTYLTIVPVGDAAESEYRNNDFELTEYSIDIGLQKRLELPKSSDDAQCDVLVGLLENLNDFLRTAGVASAVWTSRETLAPFNPDLLRTQRLFEAVARHKYQRGRST